MNLSEFTFKVRDSIGEYLSAYDVDDIYEKDVVKNNGVVYKGLVIALKEREAAPTVYMDYYFSLYKRGKSFEDILKLIYENYKLAEEKMDLTEREAGKLDNYKEKLFIKVVNFEKNKKRLENCPYIPYLDLAITFRYLVHKDKHDISSTLINNALMDMWGLNTQSIYKMAYKNMRNLFPPSIKKMSDIIGSYPDDFGIIPENEMYVITNDSSINGASYIICKEIIDDFCRKKNSDYYLIPSSIHELILVPKCLDEDGENLKMFVKEVNKTAVLPEDFLSDNVYFYSRDNGIKMI